MRWLEIKDAQVKGRRAAGVALLVALAISGISVQSCSWIGFTGVEQDDVTNLVGVVDSSALSRALGERGLDRLSGGELTAAAVDFRQSRSLARVKAKEEFGDTPLSDFKQQLTTLTFRWARANSAALRATRRERPARKDAALSSSEAIGAKLDTLLRDTDYDDLTYGMFKNDEAQANTDHEFELVAKGPRS